MTMTSNDGDASPVSALEYELNQVGLSVDDLRPPTDGHFDRRTLARVESAQILSKKFIERDKVKEDIQRKQIEYKKRLRDNRNLKTATWQQKTVRSPFLVDLLAENERIDEDNRVRLQEEARRVRVMEQRKEKAKNGIILQALSEASDLEALRREKRAIVEEERRLKALLDIEKTAGHRKAQMLAAQRAERQRKQTKADYRRRQFTEALDDHYNREAELLRQKLDAAPPPTDTFTSFGN